MINFLNVDFYWILLSYNKETNFVYITYIFRNWKLLMKFKISILQSFVFVIINFLCNKGCVENFHIKQ